MAETDYKAELDAVQSILALLTNFDEATRTKILRTVNAFYSEPGERIPTAPSATEEFFKARPTSAKQFILEKQPHTAIERVTCLAYFLTRFRDIREFKTADIIQLNMEAAQPKLANASSALKDAVKAGMLTSAGGGKRQIGALGELYVDALPDRAAARDAVAKLARRPYIKRARQKSSGPVE
jgi:hypothetical protein